VLEPTGPLPPEIYWRRRLLAIAALVLALALVIWLAFALLRSGGSGDKKSAKAATSSQTTAKGTAAAPVTSAAPTTSDTAAKPAGANATTTVAAALCSDQSLAVKLTVSRPSFKSGEQPVFGIVITIISTVACQRDMGSGLPQVSVQTLDGQKRTWANTDCDSGGPADVRTLGGGQQAAFTLTWSGTSSQPGCAGERTPVPSGPYSAIATFGSLRSAPETFNIG
jgi:hypothetical protein